MKRMVLLTFVSISLAGCMGVDDGIRTVSNTHARSVSAVAIALATAANTTGACAAMGLPEHSATGRVRVRNDGEVEYNARNHYSPSLGSFELELESDVQADSTRRCGNGYRR